MRLLVLAAAIALAATSAGSAADATFTVNSHLDLPDLDAGDGICDADLAEGEQCTLRAAVDETNALAGADTILVPPAAEGYSIVALDGDDENRGGDFDILDHLTIRGTGETPDEVRIDGQGESRAFDIFRHVEGDVVVQSDVTIANLHIAFGGGEPEPCGGVCGGMSVRNQSILLLEDVVITDGFDASNAEAGGAVYNADFATLRNVRLERNSAGGSGGAVYNADLAVLTIEKSAFTLNSTGDDGGAIFNNGGDVFVDDSIFVENTALGFPNDELANGGAIANFLGSATINRSVFRGNQARSNGGAISQVESNPLFIGDTTIDSNAAVEGNGGGLWSDSSVQIRRSTLSRNTATRGAGIYNSGPLRVVNSTISTNHAQSQGGGIYNATPEGSTAQFEASTIANNAGGGVFTEVGAAMTFRSTIVVGSSGGPGTPGNCAGDTSGITIQSLGWNMEPLEQCPFLNGENGVDDFAGFNPHLEPLQDNGGPTETHALPADSPAVDVVPPNDDVPTDQRGVKRPQGEASDIGAFELGEPVSLADVSVTKTDNFDPVTVGDQLTYAIAVFNGGPASAENVTLTDPLPAGVTFVNVTSTAGSCAVVAAVVTCQLGTLAANNGVVVTIVVVPQAAGTLDNTATATTTSFDPNELNNSDSEQTTVNAPTVSIGNASATEGDSGPTAMTFTLTRSTSNGVSTVTFATSDGSATAGDYEAASGTVIFKDGQATATLTVNVLGDTADEPNETFQVTLTAGTNSTISGGPGQGTIIDDDEPALPVLAIDDVTVTEGDSGTVDAVFTVSRTGGTGVSTVDWETANDTATAGPDYTGASDSVSFEGDETSMTISISVLGDTTDEANETFFVNLSNASGATIADGQGIGTIVDDDSSSPPAPFLVEGPCSKHGSLGDDKLEGSVAGDWICGWRGDDTIFGLAGADRLLGGDGDDLLDGGLGPDDLDAGPGADVIDAFGDGPDEVDGGPGFDTCYCGPEDNVTGIERFIPHGK